MPCNTCSKPTEPRDKTAVTFDIENPPEEGFIVVVFTRGGATSPRGLATGNRYARVSAGRLLWVDPADLDAESNRVGGPWFKAYDAPNDSIEPNDSGHDDEGENLNTIIDPTEEGSWIAALTAVQIEALIAAGFDSAEDIQAATDAELIAIDGIGKATVQNLREALS